MHFNRLLGAALAALFFLGVQNAEAASSPLTQKRGTITTQNLVPAGACTTGGCVESEITTAGSVTVQVTGTYTASGGLSAQATTDGTNWVTLCSSTCSTTFTRATTGATSATIASGVQDVFQVPATGYKRLRITALGAVTGTATITIQPTELVPSGFASISGGAGDASASNQVTGNASLASIDSKTPALGQALAAGSVPVILPAATITTLTPPAAITGYATSTKQSDGSQKTQIVDGSGNVIGATSNALDVNIKSGASSGAVAQGSTTSGQTGGLTQAAVTTSAPTYTTGQTSPLSLDTSGNLRVAVTGGAGSTISGSTAHDAAGSAVNPVAMGGYASAAAPTNVSADTDIVRAWFLRSGAAAVQPTLGGVLASAGSGTNGTGVQRVTVATDDTLVASLATKLDTLHTDITASNTQLPAALGSTTSAGSLSVTPASNASFVLGAGSATIGALTANQSVNVAQVNGVTPLMGAGNTGTGSPRVTVATDQAALATWGHGATGAAVPANVTAMGARAGANSVNVAQGSATAAINVSTATTTQLVALSGSTLIRVTGLAVVAGGTGNITFVYGTGTNCGTGTTSLSGAIPLIANAGLTLGGGLGAVMVVPAGQALCVTTSAAVQMSGFVTYTQF